MADENNQNVGGADELARIDAEIQNAERTIRSGAKHEDELLIWLADWVNEKRLLMEENLKASLGSEQVQNLSERIPEERAAHMPEFPFRIDRGNGEQSFYRDRETAQHIESLRDRNIRNPIAAAHNIDRPNIMEVEMPDNNKSTEIAMRQFDAMRCPVVEVGVFGGEAPAKVGAAMLNRDWDREKLESSMPWLRYANAAGSHIYVRPKGETSLSLVDDLKLETIERMKAKGYEPAVIVETSPNNYQAWLDHGKELDPERASLAAKLLAKELDGDVKAASWRHYGRLAGFTNRKDKHFDADKGFYPYVKLISTDPGRVYENADVIVWNVNKSIDHERARIARESAIAHLWPHKQNTTLLTIDHFHKTEPDGHVADMKFAKYAVSHGMSETSIMRAIEDNRDLSHKGGRRQIQDYLKRTVKKAERGLGLGM